MANMAASLSVLIDLNILLDVLQKREPFYAASAGVLAAAERGQTRASIAAHTVTTLFYLIAKDQSPANAKNLIHAILGFIRVADVTQATVEAALVLPMIDFEDTVQLAAALDAQVDYLVTRNIKDYPKTNIPIVAPPELLVLL
jgi:predicted nucleic acid-binding protein